MDKASLNIISLVIGGAGLLGALTKFHVPELRMSFWGENLFAIKRDAIDGVMTWIFTLLALVGLVVQVCSEIWGHGLPERLHDTCIYVLLFITVVTSSAVLVVSLMAAGRRIARRYWQPTIIEKMREAYNRARPIVEHDQHADFETASKTLGHIEKLLEIPSGSSDLKGRVERLRPYFEQR